MNAKSGCPSLSMFSSGLARMGGFLLLLLCSFEGLFLLSLILLSLSLLKLGIHERAAV